MYVPIVHHDLQSETAPVSQSELGSLLMNVEHTGFKSSLMVLYGRLHYISEIKAKSQYA